MKPYLRIPATITSFFLSLLINEEARAATVTIDPTITFEVGDGFSPGTFDGKGDVDAVFPGNFDTVVLGTLGENSENAEFDISAFSLPPQENLTRAIFQVQISSLLVGGLGVNFGENPSSLGVLGYVGNGQPDAFDFEAGTLLDTVNLSSPFVGQILTFNVTNFVNNLVSNGDAFVGLSVRAQDFGGLALSPPPDVKLRITTVPEATSILSLLALMALLPFMKRVNISKTTGRI